jgi:hypothetical protein
MGGRVFFEEGGRSVVVGGCLGVAWGWNGFEDVGRVEIRTSQDPMHWRKAGVHGDREQRSLG